ncbi:MAG TPA: hypothetical protein VEZ47_00700 [Gemmatirosa sp.]|nr:hypothetical protein [Gemmatirosa sp.]
MPILRDALPPTVHGTAYGTLRARMMRPERVRPVPWGPVLMALLTGLLLGVGWQYPRASAFARRAAVAEEATVTARLEAQLAATALAARAGAFPAALEHARDFYAKVDAALRGEVGGPDRVTGETPTRSVLRQARAERETVLALLAAGDGSAVPRLEAAHAALRRAARGAIAPGTRADLANPAP